MELKETERKILFELIKSAKRGDKELSDAARVSKPSAMRTRMKLEKLGYIREYTVIPDLRKMGYELLVFTFMSFTEDRPELFQKAREWIKSQPSVLYADNGDGLGMNSMMLSIHKDYASYTRLITDLRRDWQPNLTNTQSFIISLARPDLATRSFSFRHLLGQKT